MPLYCLRRLWQVNAPLKGLAYTECGFRKSAHLICCRLPLVSWRSHSTGRLVIPAISVECDLHGAQVADLLRPDSRLGNLANEAASIDSSL
jgi:hypothetical protein